MAFGEIHEQSKVFYGLWHQFHPEDDSTVPISGDGRVDVMNLTKEQ